MTLYTGKNKQEKEKIGTRRLILPETAATILTTRRDTIEKMIADGTLRRFQVGSKTLVYLSQIQAMIESEPRKEEEFYVKKGKRPKSTFTPP